MLAFLAPLLGPPAALAVFAALAQAANADPLAVKVGVIHEAHSRETISILDIPPADDFIAGARMAMDDNNTTGRWRPALRRVR